MGLSSSTRDHAHQIRDAFTKQAGTFEDPQLNCAFIESLAWLVESCAPQPTDVVLDVAAGTGLVVRALASVVSSAIALDATDVMLAAGKAAADRDGLNNVVFQRGDAAVLPFVDESFDLVVSRFSLHHFENPSAGLREMVRVCRPGGRVVILDLCASEDPELARRQDTVEKLRDPSHVQMVTESGLTRAFVELGLCVSLSERREVCHTLDQWLAQGCTDDDAAARIRKLFAEELDGGSPTGMGASRCGDTLQFTHTWLTVAARK
jgi:ubiquinone/menaquinone biosynthesis C-methylase UbiE